MFERRRLILGGMLALAAARPAHAVTQVRYPRSEPQGQGDQSEHYAVRLLRLALAYAGQPDAIEPPTYKMGQTRALVDLQNGRAIDVLWTMSSRQRETELLPVRIPLDMGLIGWRLLLLRRSDAARFEATPSAADLQQLSALQGHDWPDTDILLANGYRVETGSDYGGMFKMLSSSRADYFPRSVFEVWNELDAFHWDDLMVAPGLALHYPSAFYFFVRKSNPALVATIQQGLERMMADGSYARAFNDYFGDMLRRSALPLRRIFELNNPLLPAATPLARREL
ncbi:ABC-type amino acid transport substrate-binding protein [Duganella sp. CF402]|uniref:substrate-binding periplasmic protein n=1 Tax=unclassified Duganella TaxID=2636909 RepID=UPI0008D7ECCF|nr:MULTISPECIES: ABC transporter substrate-binding protein [unclassified Duganella]RZT06304.1 ABC-type amino acid transport substrate-binding protein [Duganella sp. BK701]SEM68345.1 ABC-type amino acid transport substrate-binding protein [Duganella sp. CF402]